MYARLGWWRLSTLASVFMITASTGHFAHALKVKQVKGNQALLTLESGDSPNVGDQLFVMINGKKLGLVQITKISKKNALALIKKGRAEVGSELSLAKAASGGETTSYTRRQARGSKRSRSGGFLGSSAKSAGVLVGMNSVSQNVTSTINGTRTTASMTGTGFSLKAFGDLTISGGLGATLRAGLESIKLTGSTSGTNLETSIMYLTGDLLLRYTFDLGEWTPYVAGGMGLHLPVSKTTNALQDVPMMTVLFLNGGVNYSFSPTMYATGLLEYALFPPSADVSTTFLAVRGGVGYRF